MGIPAYFSNLIKKYPDIIQKLIKNERTINHFFLDSNSIVYDAARNINFDEITETAANAIIAGVISKIEEYILIVNPDTTIMIALDGTPPIAKLEQQRQRRYKSWYIGEITKSIKKKTTPDPFNTVEITCGTNFMKILNDRLNTHFKNPANYGVKKLIVSSSDEASEGEHKIFEYIRENKENVCNDTHLIYGLDSDLIMLCINHIPICPNIFLFRETPEFIKSIDRSLEPNANYIMDIPVLSKMITFDMNNDIDSVKMIENRAPDYCPLDSVLLKGKNKSNNKNYKKTNKTNKNTTTLDTSVDDCIAQIVNENSVVQEVFVNRNYDYIFMCFFLGNDFLPHFPALNIRTGGIDKMLNAYKATIGGTKEVLTDGKTIYWKNVRKMVAFLADKEEEYIIAEMKLRAKRENTYYPDDDPDQMYRKFEAIPTTERELEKYIDPIKDYWEVRYYRALFGIDANLEQKKEISINYLEGLEWTMKYYTSGCPDWRWRYNFSYPPLLKHLLPHIPEFDTVFVPEKPRNPVSQIVQLCYVLPLDCLDLLPLKIYKNLLLEHHQWYGTDYDFIWSFCKYFWESHVRLPKIDIAKLEEFAKRF